MKVCLNSRQSAEYLKKADEILFAYRDRQAIPEIAEQYPNATCILEIPKEENYSVDEIREFNILTKNKLILCIGNLNDVILTRLGIPYFWEYRICSYEDLMAVKNMGVDSFLVGAPLFFQTDLIKKSGLKARVVTNAAQDGTLMHTSGINGTWIRPEDLEMYADIVESISFSANTLSQEQALYRIYCENKEWSGNISDIVFYLNADATNRLLPPQFTEYRLNCGQKCYKCNLCDRYFSLANEEKIKNWSEKHRDIK